MRRVAAATRRAGQSSRRSHECWHGLLACSLETLAGGAPLLPFAYRLGARYQVGVPLPAPRYSRVVVCATWSASRPWVWVTRGVGYGCWPRKRVVGIGWAARGGPPEGWGRAAIWSRSSSLWGVGRSKIFHVVAPSWENSTGWREAGAHSKNSREAYHVPVGTDPLPTSAQPDV